MAVSARCAACSASAASRKNEAAALDSALGELNRWSGVAATRSRIAAARLVETSARTGDWPIACGLEETRAADRFAVALTAKIEDVRLEAARFAQKFFAAD